MSPEQASAEPKLDARSDIYSLGCVLYEMLAGEPPYTGPTAQALVAKHLAAVVPSVRTVRPDLPPHLDSAIRRALAKSPAARFPTAGAFATELGRSRRMVSPGYPVRIAAIAVIIVLLAMVGIERTRHGARQAESGTNDRASVAVLPFTNLSPRSGQRLLQ